MCCPGVDYPSNRRVTAGDKHQSVQVGALVLMQYIVHQLTKLCLAACRKLSLSRKLPCTKCNGTGSKSGKRHTCSTCQGSGVQVHIRPLGPGMVQQIQSRCGDCQGSGYSSIPSECSGVQWGIGAPVFICCCYWTHGPCCCGLFSP